MSEVFGPDEVREQETCARSKDMDEQQFMLFMRNFEVVRPGAYGVPENVLLATFRSFMDNGSLKPLLAYERAVYFSWDAANLGTGMPEGTKFLYPQAELDMIGKFLAGEGYWKPEDVFSDREIRSMETHFRSGLLSVEEYEERQKSYEVRRQKACSYITKKDVRSAVFKKDGRRCRKCGSPSRLTVDHIIPVMHGGGDTLDNLQTLCAPCNSSKGARI